jgi:small conductance mechanosensitive channel
MGRSFYRHVLWSEPLEEVAMTRDALMDLAVRYGFQVLGAVVILGVGALLGRWLARVTDRRLAARAMEPPMRVLIGRVLRLVVMLFAVVVALDKFGFQIAPLVAGIGVAGLGVGIALQGVLGNLVAGLTIIFTKPFRVGEYVEIAGVSGEVVTIELFSTTLRHPDLSRVIVPNRKIVGEILHNSGTMRQLHLLVTVPLAADVPAALAAATDVVARNERVLKDPLPIVGIAQISDTGIRIGVNPWVRIPDVGPAEGELYRSLAEHFQGRGLRLGLGATDIHLVNGAAGRPLPA